MSAMGKPAQKDEGKLSVGSVGGSSVMLLSVVQGDQRGEATAEEGSLLRKKASRRSPVSATLQVWKHQVHMSTGHRIRLELFFTGVVFWG